VDSFGLIMTAEREIRVLLERQSGGMTLKEIAKKCMTYARLSRADKPKVLAQLTKSGLVAEYKILKGRGSKSETMFHHRMHGSIYKFRGLPVSKAYPREDITGKSDRTKLKLSAIKEPETNPAPAQEQLQIEMDAPTENAINAVSAADLTKQAAQLLEVAKALEGRENPSKLKEQVASLQLVVAESVCLMRKHIDGQVIAMTELEKASEALRKLID